MTIARNNLPLLAAVSLALAPHLVAQPLWLALTLAGLLALQVLMQYRQVMPLSRWVVVLLAFGLAALTFLAHRTLIGRDGGMALLACLIAAKLFECRNGRDQTVLVLLGYFSTAVFFLHSQSPGMAILALCSCALLTLAALRIDQPQGFLPQQFRLVMRLLIEAMPLAVLLFLLFPRLPGPLWQMPGENMARSGLSSDVMEPGRVSRLALDDSVAFRAEFAGRPPAPELLYWRGPVFEYFDGRRWLPGMRAGLGAPHITPIGPSTSYTLTLEPHQQRWLLALDLPTAWPTGAVLGSRLQVLSPMPVSQRQRYTMQSTLDWRIEADPMRQAALSLPAQGNPRTRALGTGWLNLAPAERILAGLAFLRDNGFAYTLEPPLLDSADPIDEFLFESKLGFCEHFAGSFALLMRAAGLPARVVTGYQGGAWNQAGDYLIVRQADAHAWVEVWLEGKGWQRIDPTAVIAPQRIRSGLSASIPQRDTLPLMLRNETSWLKTLRLNLDVAVNGWNQWVIGYNMQRQMDLLQKLGISELRSRAHLIWFLNFLALALGGIACWILLPRRKYSNDPAKRQYQCFCRKLARREIVALPQEGPEDFALRASAVLPNLAREIHSIAQLYISIRYGGNTEQIQKLRQQVRQFRC